MPTTIEWVQCSTCKGWGYIDLGVNGAIATCTACGGRGEVQRITHTK